MDVRINVTLCTVGNKVGIFDRCFVGMEVGINVKLRSVGWDVGNKVGNVG
jgi:hypothetical protein